MTRPLIGRVGSTAIALLSAVSGSLLCSAQAAKEKNDQIESVVIIFAENRSFDNLYGHFPGANGIDQATKESIQQRDRDGSVLKELPPIWDGLTAKGVNPPVTQAATEH